MSAAAIFRQLCDNGSVNRNELSESTVNRFLNSLARKERTANNQDMRRYERAHVNEVWCGDSSVGPYLKTEDGRKHKVYVIALIDDASRCIVGIDVFFNDNFVNLMSVMKFAVAKFGVPKLFNFDNGSSYKNRQMNLLAARIGSTVYYDQPYTKRFSNIFRNRKRTTNWRTEESRRAFFRRRPVKMALRNPASGGTREIPRRGQS